MYKYGVKSAIIDVIIISITIVIALLRLNDSADNGENDVPSAKYRGGHVNSSD